MEPPFAQGALEHDVGDEGGVPEILSGSLVAQDPGRLDDRLDVLAGLDEGAAVLLVIDELAPRLGEQVEQGGFAHEPSRIGRRSAPNERAGEAEGIASPARWMGGGRPPEEPGWNNPGPVPVGLTSARKLADFRRCPSSARPAFKSFTRTPVPPRYGDEQVAMSPGHGWTVRGTVHLLMDQP